ncbi:MAG: HNH endonuclease, partial [Actinobacteria bacterium]|nr:HNH endonuclease [Actinomycetota bacterium]
MSTTPLPHRLAQPELEVLPWIRPFILNKLVAMARRLAELPATRAALEAGELAEDQVAVICRHTPAHNDAEVAELARSATVAQLRRTLGRHSFAKPEPEPEPEPRRVNFGFGDDGSWHLSAALPADEGALLERALGVHRQKLFAGDADHGDAPAMVSWADALLAMAEASLATEAIARPHHDRHVVVVHVGSDDTGAANGHVHLGPALPDSLRRFMTCDANARVQHDDRARPLSVGRTARIVSHRTRLAIEERDGGCRVPGCDRDKWLHVHHVVHWENGGATDTSNLMALCGRHHRLHHRGHLGIAGDADEADGITFTDARGRPLPPSAKPMPPTASPPTGNWVHP